MQEALVGVMPPRKEATVKVKVKKDSSKEATDKNCEEKTTITAEGCPDVDMK